MRPYTVYKYIPFFLQLLFTMQRNEHIYLFRFLTWHFFNLILPGMWKHCVDSFGWSDANRMKKKREKQTSNNNNRNNKKFFCEFWTVWSPLCLVCVSSVWFDVYAIVPYRKWACQINVFNIAANCTTLKFLPLKWNNTKLERRHTHDKSSVTHHSRLAAMNNADRATVTTRNTDKKMKLIFKMG